MPECELDPPTRERIERLVQEEKRLLLQPALADADYRRLREIHFELDRYWDLLRRRRKLRTAPPRPIKPRTDLEKG